jgi:branched-chain amino acid aminotransferase
MAIVTKFLRTNVPGEISLLGKYEEQGSFDDISRKYPEGAYVTFRTYEGNKAFHLNDHISRLISTLRVAIIDNLNIDFDIRKALHELFSEHGTGDQRVRLIVPFSDKLTLFVLVEEIVTLDSLLYDRGVEVITALYERLEPERKQTGFITASKELRSRLIPPVNEVLLVNHDGYILEGLSSNVFFVKGSAVITAGEGILAGVTRKVVLETCNDLDIQIHLTAVLAEEIMQYEEAFITSTSRAVLPVVKIDGKQIGDGFPGQVTRSVMQGFAARISAGLEDL